MLYLLLVYYKKDPEDKDEPEKKGILMFDCKDEAELKKDIDNCKNLNFSTPEVGYFDGKDWCICLETKVYELVARGEIISRNRRYEKT